MDIAGGSGDYDVLLLSTKAGGVGIHIVHANRVIIFDPDWTPSNDNQVMDRLHRIGQQRKVECYYLIAAGTVGELTVGIFVHAHALYNFLPHLFVFFHKQRRK